MMIDDRRRPTLPKPLEPGSTVGILGGGQLGRMLAMAAARLGLRCRIYCDAETSPAAEVSAAATIGAYDNTETLARFAGAVDVVTYEFENVPVETAKFLAAITPVYPPPTALDVAQDRLTEKRFIAGLGIAVAPFAPVDDEHAIDTAAATVGLPAILKTRRLGYDGKGQVRLAAAAELAAARREIGFAPAVLEGVVAFAQEISVILVRGRADIGASSSGGGITELAYDVPVNTHKNGILDRSRVPAQISPAKRREALEIASKIARALDYIGVLAVELFDPGHDAGDALIVNEIAPRVHNSGHWTMDACFADQFENHIRAVAGWPLAPTERHCDVEMRNLIGPDVLHWRELLRQDHTVLHLYGKREARDGRKMGHINTLRRHLTEQS